MKQPIAIAGGGIGGLTAAIALQRKGFDVKVYESAPVIKPLGAGLALAGNAVKALQRIGIADEVVRHGQKMKVMYGKNENGRVISLTNTEKLTEQFGVLNNFTIHRADLHEALSNLLLPGTLETGRALATLGYALEKYPVVEAFQRFEKHRIPRTTSIVNQSLNLGKMAQVENRLLMKLRDGAMRMIPLTVIDKQLRKLFDVSFEC